MQICNEAEESGKNWALYWWKCNYWLIGWLLYCTANTMQIQHKYNTNTTQIHHKYNINTLQMQHRQITKTVRVWENQCNILACLQIEVQWETTWIDATIANSVSTATSNAQFVFVTCVMHSDALVTSCTPSFRWKAQLPDTPFVFVICYTCTCYI